jgi:hypothetical protein
MLYTLIALAVALEKVTRLRLGQRSPVAGEARGAGWRPHLPRTA